MDDRARCHTFRRGLFGHGLMLFGVKGLALGVLALHAIAFQNAKEGPLHPFKPRAELGKQIRLIHSYRRQGFDAAAQVFGGFHHIAREFLRGIGARIGHFALGAGTQVLHLGLGTQPFVAQRLHLLRQHDKPFLGGHFFGFGGGFGRRLRGVGVGRIGHLGIAWLLAEGFGGTAGEGPFT